MSDPQPEPEIDSDLFNQFARIDEGLLAWDFRLRNARGEEIASVIRAFRGFGREVRRVYCSFLRSSHDTLR